MSTTEYISRRAFLAGLAFLATGARVERGFPTPPEVLDYFRDKKLAPRFSWLDVWGEEHAHAFTVAGVLEDKVLAEFRAGIDQALKDGTGFDKFKADMERRLKPVGWWGPRKVIDPEGTKMKTVDFTRPRRLETTFWSNVRAARAAGQWDRIQRTKRALPFLLYVRTTAGDPRQEHLRWAGIILPVDHPFWRTHFPPNGWGCKCAVRQITAAQAERLLGRPPEDGGIIYRDTPPAERMRTFVNKRTGVRTQVPDGIDPGWHTNPGVGRSRTLVRILQDQLDATPADMARPRIQKIIADDGFLSHVLSARRLGIERAAVKKALKDAGRDAAAVDLSHPWPRTAWPVATINDGLARDIGAKLRTVTASDAAMAHNPTHPLPAAMWRLVQLMLDGSDIWRRRSDGRLLAMIEVDGKFYMSWIDLGAGGHLEVATLYPSSRGRNTGYVRNILEGCDRVR
ncbi:Uncharacterised protein [Starkeya nomas]|uniref:Phage head morphogenesis domain-containing protein n=1 Tax=Starkeya nomas TaxID=2666134 RepID=A0A5S9PBM4_9HYPH|nr:phage minor head protein [Starkeya nomas]CAA0101236.1 Uncharacterised protein [Starkeya nomas]